MKVIAVAAFALLALAAPAGAFASAPAPVDLQTAAPFALFATAAITDVPTSTIAGNVGLTPAAGTFITGLTCAEVTGTIYDVNGTGPAPCTVMNTGLLTTLHTDVGNAYGDAAGRLPDMTYVTGDNQLGGQSLVPGVYRFPAASTANLTGNLTLVGNADSVWIFQATSTFKTASSSTVTLTGGAQACHVFWQVASTVTLGSSSTLVGTVLAFDNMDVLSAVTVNGRLLAGAQANGLLTLINDTVTTPTTCVTQASIDAANDAAAQAQAAAAAAAVQAEAAQAAAAQAAAAAAAADAKAAAAAAALATQKAAAAAQAAAVAKAAAKRAAAVKAKAVIAKAAAARAARAATVAHAAAVKARAAAHKAAVKAAAIAKKRAAVPAPATHVGFTG
jgi:Ice-binding-like